MFYPLIKIFCHFFVHRLYLFASMNQTASPKWKKKIFFFAFRSSERSELQVHNTYCLYFGRIVHQDKPWIPQLFCVSCYATLLFWQNGNKTSIPFAVPTLWREPSYHYNDCYFFMTDIWKFSWKIKQNIELSTVNSVSEAIFHSEDMPPPLPPHTCQTVEPHSSQHKRKS